MQRWERLSQPSWQLQDKRARGRKTGVLDRNGCARQPLPCLVLAGRPGRGRGPELENWSGSWRCCSWRLQALALPASGSLWEELSSAPLWPMAETHLQVAISGNRKMLFSAQRPSLCEESLAKLLAGGNMEKCPWWLIGVSERFPSRMPEVSSTRAC